MAEASPSSEECSPDRKAAETDRRVEGLVPTQELEPHSPPTLECDRIPGTRRHHTPGRPLYRVGDYAHRT